MRRSGVTIVFDPRLVLGVALAVLASLMWTGVAAAQSAGDQYAAPTSPTGPATGAQCTVAGDTDGVVNAGDTITCAGDYQISGGASVVLQDADGTRGTFVDGQNATITEGSIDIAVKADPFDVNGGNGVLNTKGLFVVATTGITATGGPGTVESTGTGGAVAGAAAGGASATGGGAAGQGGAQAGVAQAGVLPDTGGMASLGLLGAFMLLGLGVLLLARGRFSGER